MLTQLLTLALLAGLTSATLLLCFAKWGWLQAWEVRRPAWLMKRCDFCAGFYLSLFQVAAYMAVSEISAWHILAAFPAAAVCRAFYSRWPAE